MSTFRIMLLIVQLGLIGFLLFYAVPQTIKSRRGMNKAFEEVRAEIEETKKLWDLCLPIFQYRATDADIAAFQAYRVKWEARHGKVKG